MVVLPVCNCPSALGSLTIAIAKPPATFRLLTLALGICFLAAAVALLRYLLCWLAGCKKWNRSVTITMAAINPATRSTTFRSFSCSYPPGLLTLFVNLVFGEYGFHCIMFLPISY